MNIQNRSDNRTGWRGLRSLWRNRRGSISAITALAVPMAMGFVCVGTDVGVVYWEKKRLQTTADAAALAGASQLPSATNAATTAISYATANMPTGRYGNVLQSADVVAGQWTPGTGGAQGTFTPGGNSTAIRVTLRRTVANGNPVKTFFTGIFGISQVNIQVSATATYGTTQSWDVHIVNDVSSSFASQISNMQAADQTLLNCQYNNTNSNSKFALTSFTGTYQSVVGLQQNNSTNHSTLNTAITNLKDCSSGGPTCSGTNLAAGLYQGRTSLAGTGTNYSTSKTTAGGIVIVTDGQSNASSAGQTFYGLTANGGDGSCGLSGKPNCTDANLASFAQTQAAAAGAAGMSVFVVYFQDTGTTNTQANTDIAFLSTLLQGNGKTVGVVNTGTGTQLSTLMTQVCSSIPKRLVD